MGIAVGGYVVERRRKRTGFSGDDHDKLLRLQGSWRNFRSSQPSETAHGGSVLLSFQDNSLSEESWRMLQPALVATLATVCNPAGIGLLQRPVPKPAGHAPCAVVIHDSATLKARRPRPAGLPPPVQSCRASRPDQTVGPPSGLWRSGDLRLVVAICQLANPSSPQYPPIGTCEAVLLLRSRASIPPPRGGRDPWNPVLEQRLRVSKPHSAMHGWRRSRF